MSELTSDYWQQRYRENRTGWDRGEINPALAKWLSDGRLTPGRIFVPGCGNGHEVIELCRRGFDVTAVDFADAAVETLKAKLKQHSLTATVVQGDLLQIDISEPFDAIYEQTCLCALHPSTWPNYVTRLHQWLKMEGRLFTLFMQSPGPDGPPFDCNLNRMKELFIADRWDWPSENFRVEHPMGMHEVAVILKKQKE